jgi:nucleoside-diphosphate-sugar epimerase
MLDVFEREHSECRVVRFRPAFLFKAPASPEQQRIFAGRLVPSRLAGRLRLPLVPSPPGLVFQALHTDDAARAYVTASIGDARGAFNLAAEPVVNAQLISEVFGGRPVTVPARPVRMLMAAAWQTGLLPTPPALFDYVLQVPVMDSGRARRELGWAPRLTSAEALVELRRGLADPAGLATPPLES